MEFIGNKKVVKFLEKVLDGESYSQAYLFSGPENVGKFFLAKMFSKAVIEGEKKFFENNFNNENIFDLIVVAPQIEESKGKIKEKEIPIEEIRKAKKEMSLFPHNGKRKILIVNNAHKMNISAQNSLLKMLEEPNSTSLIILISHEESRLLPTIKSRCQKVGFSLVDGVDMEKVKPLVGEVDFEKYEAMSMGRPGLLFSFLEDEKLLQEYESYYAGFEKIGNSSLNEKLSYAEEISKDARISVRMLNVWVWMLRKSFFADNQEAESVYSKIQSIEEASSQIKNTNSNSRIILENLLINI